MAGPNPVGSNTGPLGIPPGGPWFVFGSSGTIQRQSNPLLAAGLANSGWVGFPTKTLAENYAKTGIGAQARHATGGLTNPLGGINAIGDFFNRLTQGNTWLRVGEVAAGLLLLYLGLNAAFRGTPVGNAVQSATGTAKKAAKISGAAAGV